MRRRESTAFEESSDLPGSGPTFGPENFSSSIDRENEQPHRDFFAISLEDDTESDINFLNATPPGEPSNWHFHAVAGRFTEAAREVFKNASDQLPGESIKNLFKKSDYDQHG